MIQTIDPLLETWVITPTHAAELLEKNTSNRPLRDAQVIPLARDIAADRWRLNGETIKIAVDGTVLDGQHRLAAVVLAGKRIETFVITNLDPSFQNTVDTGLKRSLTDIFALNGETGAQKLSSTISAIFETQGIIDGVARTRPTIQEATAFLNAQRGAVQRSSDVGAVCSASGLFGGAGLFGSLHFLLTQIDPDDADKFFHQLATGANLATGSGVLHLRNMLANRDRVKVYTRRSRVALVIKAWNAYRKNEPMSVLKFGSSGKSKESFPRAI